MKTIENSCSVILGFLSVILTVSYYKLFPYWLLIDSSALLTHFFLLLLFGTTGTSLLSGGIESVLVQWRDGSDAKKEFLPRLGATIQHISVSPDGTLLCTSHSDNSKAKLGRFAIVFLV